MLTLATIHAGSRASAILFNWVVHKYVKDVGCLVPRHLLIPLPSILSLASHEPVLAPVADGAGKGSGSTESKREESEFWDAELIAHELNPGRRRSRSRLAHPVTGSQGTILARATPASWVSLRS
jgi:hypothetical protein